MKITNLLFVAGAAFGMLSCGSSSEEAAEVEVDLKTLSVDTDASSLSWKGMKSAEDFHTGTVNFTDGTAEFADGNFVSGEFKVDLTSMVVTDALPDDKKEMLKGHLGSPDYFDVAKNASVSVKASALVDGKMPIVISLSGMEITQTIPATVTYADGQGSISGTFDVDFSALKAAGFMPKEGETEFVQPVVNFNLNLKLK